jgi:hypothetical protein
VVSAGNGVGQLTRPIRGLSEQRAVRVGELLGAQRLRARIVLPVERRDDVGTADRGRVRGRAEPHPDVILVHRSELRVRRRVGERSIVHRGGGPDPGATVNVSMLKRPTKTPCAFPAPLVSKSP